MVAGLVARVGGGPMRNVLSCVGEGGRLVRGRVGRGGGAIVPLAVGCLGRNGSAMVPTVSSAGFESTDGPSEEGGGS